jgi:hypothetical protein
MKFGLTGSYLGFRKPDSLLFSGLVTKFSDMSKEKASGASDFGKAVPMIMLSA